MSAEDTFAKVRDPIFEQSLHDLCMAQTIGMERIPNEVRIRYIANVMSKALDDVADALIVGTKLN